MKAHGDVTGRISAQFRKAFVNSEFGRYKKLQHSVETFEMEARRASAFMPNVWKKVTPQFVTSDFLSKTVTHSRNGADEARRGSMDAFVAESEEEDDEDDEDEEEKVAAAAHVAVLKLKGPRESDSDATRWESGPPPVLPSTPVDLSAMGTPLQEEKTETDVEDLRCLVCGENPRNGGIVHGQYLHFYCCFRCGKRQLRAGMGCLVCDRPIDKVLRMLPLTPEARQAIQANNQ